MASTRAVGVVHIAQDDRPSQETTGVLIDAKLILREARLRISRGRSSRLDSRQALKDAHHAVELVLRRKAEESGTNPYEFAQIVKEVKKRVPIFYERELDELNKSRVLSQHYGTVLDGKDVYRLLVAAENFMKDFYKDAFEVDFDQLSELDSVENEDIKGTLEEARKLLGERSFEDASISAHLAVEKAKWIIERKFSPGSYGSHLRRISFGYGGLGFRDLDNTLHEMMEEIEYNRDLALSAPFARELKRLKEITRAAFFRMADGHVETQVMKELRDQEPNADDAKFAVDLATEYVLWADQMYGLAESPQVKNE